MPDYLIDKAGSSGEEDKAINEKPTAASRGVHLGKNTMCGRRSHRLRPGDCIKSGAPRNHSFLEGFAAGDGQIDARHVTAFFGKQKSYDRNDFLDGGETTLRVLLGGQLEQLVRHIGQE